MFDALVVNDMRTTLALDDDVLAAARDLAARQHKSLGEVISALARQALRPDQSKSTTRNGILLLAPRTVPEPVTLELVNRLRDELP